MSEEKDIFIDLFEEEDIELVEAEDDGLVKKSKTQEQISERVRDLERKSEQRAVRTQGTRNNRSSQKRPVNKKKKALMIAGRVGAVLLITVVLVLVFLWGIIMIMVKGPSPAAKNQFVCFANETSALKFLPYWFLPDKEVKEILEGNKMVELEDGVVSDTSGIVIPGDNTDTNEPPIQLKELKGVTYRGKLMIIKDPSRVSVGIVDRFYEGTGLVVNDICKKYGAVAGVNGGEFYDIGTINYTALPVGGVISQGKHVYGDLNTTYNLTGITKDNILVIGKMTVKEALAMGVRDAVHTKHTTGPFLLLNGEPLTVPSPEVYGGGKNPRTAIGQRADGAIILLAIDGRQANSLGATFEELAYIMLEHGAVNACAMDGGTSTQMVYENEVVNSPYSPSGPRKCPTAWIVK